VAACLPEAGSLDPCGSGSTDRSLCTHHRNDVAKFEPARRLQNLTLECALVVRLNSLLTKIPGRLKYFVVSRVKNFDSGVVAAPFSVRFYFCSLAPGAIYGVKKAP
jgi:hypothetical protein